MPASATWNSALRPPLPRARSSPPLGSTRLPAAAKAARWRSSIESSPTQLATDDPPRHRRRRSDLGCGMAHGSGDGGDRGGRLASARHRRRGAAPRAARRTDPAPRGHHAERRGGVRSAGGLGGRRGLHAAREAHSAGGHPQPVVADRHRPRVEDRALYGRRDPGPPSTVELARPTHGRPSSLTPLLLTALLLPLQVGADSEVQTLIAASMDANTSRALLAGVRRAVALR